MTGRISDLLDASQTGSHLSLMQNTSIRKVANTKDGIAVNSVVKKTMIRSIGPFLNRAAIEPSIMPAITANTAAVRPRRPDTLKQEKSVSLISRPVLSDTPKSPCRRFLRYRTNCTGTGLSRL